MKRVMTFMAGHERRINEAFRQPLSPLVLAWLQYTSSFHELTPFLVTLRFSCHLREFKKCEMSIAVVLFEDEIVVNGDIAQV